MTIKLTSSFFFKLVFHLFRRSSCEISLCKIGIYCRRISPCAARSLQLTKLIQAFADNIMYPLTILNEYRLGLTSHI